MARRPSGKSVGLGGERLRNFCRYGAVCRADWSRRVRGSLYGEGERRNPPLQASAGEGKQLLLSAYDCRTRRLIMFVRHAGESCKWRRQSHKPDGGSRLRLRSGLRRPAGAQSTGLAGSDLRRLIARRRARAAAVSDSSSPSAWPRWAPRSSRRGEADDETPQPAAAGGAGR